MNEENRYQILVTNIAWNTASFTPTKSNKNPEFDDQITLDVPTSVLNEANKKKNNFDDVHELDGSLGVGSDENTGAGSQCCCIG